MKNNLMKNTILLSIGVLLTKGLLFIMIPFFSSWLSIEEYGTFDVLCTYVTLCIPILSLASSDSLFRFSIDVDDEEKKKYVTNGLILYLRNLALLSIVMIAIRIIFKWNLAIPFLLLAIGEVINDYFQGCLRGLKKLNIYSLGMAVTTVFIAILSTIFIKIANLGLLGIIYGYSLGYIIGNLFIIFIIKFWKYISFKLYSKQTIKEMITYSFPLIFNNISWWVVNVSDRSIIRLFLGSAANGIYAIANKVPALCTSVFGMFSISWQQTASEMIDSKERNKYFEQVYNSSISILISLCIGIISCNFLLFNYIFDPKYDLARFHTPILMLSIFLFSVSQFLGGIQISFKRPKENGITTIIGAIVNVIVNLSLIPFIGLFAASISTFVSNLVLVVLRKYRLHKIVPLKLNTKNKIYGLIFIYMILIQYISNMPLFMNIIHLLFACALFMFINKNFITKIFKKLGVVKK